MAIKFITGGLLTTVQDLGRPGYLNAGIATSGALDAPALMTANILAGNERAAAGLEITILGPSFEFTAPTVFAVTGGDFSARLNGVETGRYRAVAAKAGDVLEFGAAKSGCRGYVAFAGGIKSPIVMGSRSTNLKCAFGGFNGRALSAGDVLAFAEDRQTVKGLERRVADSPEYEKGTATIRVIPGPQAEFFTAKGTETFFSGEYKLTDRSDRMAAVLEGEAVEASGKTDIVSDAVPPGGIQIPSNGKPIVMLADRQTTGGYAKIATVIGADLALFAQRKPGEAVAFKSVSIGEAVAARKRQQKYLDALERRFAAYE